MNWSSQIHGARGAANYKRSAAMASLFKCLVPSRRSSRYKVSQQDGPVHAEEEAESQVLVPVPVASSGQKKKKNRGGPDAGGSSTGLPVGRKSRVAYLLAQSRECAQQVREVRLKLSQDFALGEMTPTYRMEVPKELERFMKTYVKSVVNDCAPLRVAVARKRVKLQHESREWARLAECAKMVGLEKAEFRTCNIHAESLRTEDEAIAECESKLNVSLAHLIELHTQLREVSKGSFEKINKITHVQINPQFKTVLLAKRLAIHAKKKAALVRMDEHERNFTKSKFVLPQEADGGLSPAEVHSLVANTQVLFAYSSHDTGPYVVENIRKSFAQDDMNLAANEYFIEGDTLKRHRCTKIVNERVLNPHYAEFFFYAAMVSHALIFVMDNSWRADSWPESREARFLRTMFHNYYRDGGDPNTYHGTDFDLIIAYRQERSFLSGRDVTSVLSKINSAAEGEMQDALVSLGVPEDRPIFFVDWKNYNKIAALVEDAIERVSTVIQAKNVYRISSQELCDLFSDTWRSQALEVEADLLANHMCASDAPVN